MQLDQTGAIGQIYKTNRTISHQLVEPNLWVWTNTDRQYNREVREGGNQKNLAKTVDIPGWLCTNPKFNPLRSNSEALHARKDNSLTLSSQVTTQMSKYQQQALGLGGVSLISPQNCNSAFSKMSILKKIETWKEAEECNPYAGWEK